MPSLSAKEQALRQKLDIPSDANQVLIFGETSHWDPNWLMLSEAYYQKRIQKILNRVLQELAQDFERVFQIECLFFLRMFWERNPDKQEQIRSFFANGQLRLLANGLTTPDTNLPLEEALIRDYLSGASWLDEQQMPSSTDLAYFPDSFGHSPGIPSLLSAMGFSYTAITRIDGMYFPGTDYRPAKDYPLPGSSADLLINIYSTSAFWWQGPDGQTVLCHWHAYTYFQGDMLAYKGLVRWMDILLGVPWRTDRHIAKRIARYTHQLTALSRTPYLYCPIGMDFNSPIPRLNELLRRYNERFYPQTGVYAVNAALEDYLQLVEEYGDHLPTLSLDPNPYWTGCYASRPGMKQTTRRLTRQFLQAEARQVLNGQSSNDSAMKRIGEIVAISNHHDFITGTSPDRVWLGEQKPWLEEAQTSLREKDRMTNDGQKSEYGEHSGPLRAYREADQVTVENSSIRLVFDQQKGGAITSWFDKKYGELLEGLANDLVFYHDRGGLWRMGHEFRGGHLKETGRASDSPAAIDWAQNDSYVTITINTASWQRRVYVYAGSRLVYLSVRGATQSRQTVTVAHHWGLPQTTCRMDVPGGTVERPPQKLHEPTFWPATSWMQLKSHQQETALTMFFELPGSARFTSSGYTEFVVLRNAPIERAWGFLRIIGHPVGGHDRGPHTIHYAIRAANENPHKAHPFDPLQTWLLGHDEQTGGSPVQIAGDGQLAGIKPYENGKGIVIRIRRINDKARTINLKLPAEKFSEAHLADALEHPREPLALNEGEMIVPLRQYLTTVLLRYSS